MGEGAYHGDASTSDLQCHKSCFCRCSSLSVIVVIALWLVRSVLTLFLGRNRDYQHLNLTFAVNVIKYGTIINMFPKPLKPCVVVAYLHPLVAVTEMHISIVARMLSNLPSQIQQEIEFIRPMVEERFAKMEEFGEDWDNKPVCQTSCLVLLSLHDSSQNDMLMWLMSEAKGVERSLEGVARRLLAVNFAAVHTTSQVSAMILVPP